MSWKNFKEVMLDDKTSYVAIMFKKYDLNDDGTITKEERDELLSKAETENPIHSKKLAEFFAFMMKNFDADGDGEITKEEFLHGVRKWMIAKAEKMFG